MLIREEFDAEDIAILDSFFPPSPDGDEGTTAHVQVSGDINNNCATTDVSNHQLLPGFDVPLIAGAEGTSSALQAYGTAADVPNSSFDDMDIGAILARLDSPLATGDEGMASNVQAAPANNFAAAADDVWNGDDIDISAILAALDSVPLPLPTGDEGTATVIHVSANDASAVNPTVLPSTSTGNGNNVGVFATEAVDAQAGNNMLVMRETNVSAGCGGLMERMELGSGFSAPMMLDAESIRPADVCDKPEDDIMSSSPCFTLPAEGFTPSFLLESPIFLPDSLVPPPSPTTGKFSSIPGGNDQINFVSAITDQSKNKGKEIVIEQGCSSFANNNHGAAASVQQNMGISHHQILPQDHAAFTVAMRNTVNVLSSGVHQFPPLYNNHGTTGISFPSPSNSFFQQHSNFYPQANNYSATFFGPANNRASGGITTTVASTEPIANRVGGGVAVASSSQRIVHNPAPDDRSSSPPDNVEEDKGRMAPKNGKYISRDGYNWRKYGQKPLKESEYPRAYYKCTYQGCPVKKQVEWADDGRVTGIIYKGQHNHPKPAPPNRGPEPQPENQVVMISNSFPHEEGGEDPAAEGDASGSKRRRCYAAEPLATGARRSVKQQRYILQTASEEDVIEDGYRWRKYGQKIVKGNPNPRSYYKCTTPGCEVRKHIERATENRIMVICSYEGNHTHEAPIPRKNSPALAQDALSRLHVQRPGPPPIPPTARPSQGGLLGRPRVHGSLPSSDIMSKSIGNNVNNVTANNQSSLGPQLGQTSGDARGTTMPKPGPVTASGGLSTAPSGGSNPNTSASGGSFATFYGGLSGSTGGGSNPNTSAGGGSFATFYGGLSGGSRTGGGSYNTFYGGGSNAMFYGGSNPTPATNAGLNNNASTAPNGGVYQFNAGGVNAAAPNGGGGVGSSQHFNGVLNNVNTGNGGVLRATGNVMTSTSHGVLNSGTGNGALDATSSSMFDQLFIAVGLNTTSNGGLYTAASNGGGPSAYQQVNGGGSNAATTSYVGIFNNTAAAYGGFNGGLNTNTGNNGGLNNNRANGGFNVSAAAHGGLMAPANGGLNTAAGNGGGLNNNGVLNVGSSATANGGFNSASAINGGLNTIGNGGRLNNNGATGGFNTNTAYGCGPNATANGGLNSTGNGGRLNNNNGATGGLNTAYGGPANGGLNSTGNGGLNNVGANGGFNSSTGLNAPANGGLNSGLNAHANGGGHIGSSSMHRHFPGSLPPPQM